MFGFLLLWLVICLILAFIGSGYFRTHTTSDQASRRRTVFIVLGVIWLIGSAFIVYQNR